VIILGLGCHHFLIVHGSYGHVTTDMVTDAIEEIDLGKGIPHEKVMANIRKKYSYA
jgi:hypothetical protein